MTREQKFEKAVYDYSKKIEKRMNGIDYFNQENIEHAFIDGIEWADANPKNPWISVKDDLPCNHKEMVKVAVEDADTYTDRVLVMSSEGMVTIAYMYKLNPYWYWSETERITHWMPIPKLEED